MKPLIIGAGLSGLIAAHAWPKAAVLEADPAPRQHHKAVLRFRGESVSALTGVEFRRVTVRKAIWSRGKFALPNLQLANEYSFKCLNRIENDRSIWNLDPVERWIAPENFYQRLIENVSARIEFNTPHDYTWTADPVISTTPLPAVLRALGVASSAKFESLPITVRRYRVSDCDVFQTVYFPEPSIPLYRASITGNLLIAESIGLAPESVNGQPLDEEGMALSKMLCRAFGLRYDSLFPIESVSQRHGKISPIDAVARRAILSRLTNEHKIYSLGRFATWRNVLLDDCVQDISVIKRLLASDSYATKLVTAGA